MPVDHANLKPSPKSSTTTLVPPNLKAEERNRDQLETRLQPQPPHQLPPQSTLSSPSEALSSSSRSKTDTVQEAEANAVPLPPVTLRQYQTETIQECLDALSSGLRRIGVSLPTGSGKTTVFMNLIPQIQFPLPPPHSDLTDTKNNSPSDPMSTRAEQLSQAQDLEAERISGREAGSDAESEGRRKGRGQTLILVGSVELASQAENAAKRILGGEWSVEVEQAHRRASGLADVTIATYQTLINPERLAKFDPARFKLVIVDEAHHAAAHSYLRLLHYFNNDVELPPPLSPIDNSFPQTDSPKTPIIGFTATFSRQDQLALSSVFEKIVIHRDITDMMEEGWLSPAKSTTVYAALGLEQVPDGANGDFKTASLAKSVDTDEVNSLVVGTYLHRAADRRSTLVFCVDLTHVANLTNAFRSAGIDARSISSKSKSAIRRETIAAFGRGEFPVLVNCEVLTEGTDIPQIDCVILARPTKSRNLLVQMVGRGLRQSPETGKQDCHIIDIVDSVGQANGLIVLPTLWGLTHEEKEERERGIGEGDPLAKGDDPAAMSKEDYEVSYVDQDDPFRLAPNARPVLAKASMSAWVACGKDRYILEAMGSGYLAINHNSPESSHNAKYVITYRHTIPPEIASPRGGSRSPFGRVRTVGHADDLERAVKTGDKFAERELGRELFLQLSRHASWRQKPASEKAIQLLMKLQGDDQPRSLIDSEGRERVLDVFGRQVPVGQLKAGQVSSWLCAARHGAKTIRAAQDRTAARAEAKRAAQVEKERLHDSRNLRVPK